MYNQAASMNRETQGSDNQPSLRGQPLPVFQGTPDRRQTPEELTPLGEIQTASFVVGTEACNARCQFCVSKMTPGQGISLKAPEINWSRFDRFMQYAAAGDAKTAMMTGKGEPTLFPDHITQYLQRIQEDEQKLGFAFKEKELQTNAIVFAQKPEKFNPLLKRWKELGMTKIAISIVHYDQEANRQTYLPYKDQYIDLPGVIKQIHDAGIQVRLATVLVDGNIDSAEKMSSLIDFARRNGVDELTVRPVNKPEESRNDDVSEWVEENYLRPENYQEIVKYVTDHGREVTRFPFGAVVYEVAGQNVCITNSLTKDTDDNYHRQLIFLPHGKITTDWTEEDEIL